MMQSRTHTCGQLRIENAGEHVTLVGWMENVREVGQNFAFVVVRDFYGTTQVVIETEDMMKVVKSLNKESTIAVEGTVRERASKNPKLPTGDIEVVPTKIEVLGRCRYNELPFEINRSRDADEALRVMREMAAELNIDPAKVGVSGTSAGGYLAGSVGTLSEVKPDFMILYYPVISADADKRHKGTFVQLLGADDADKPVAQEFSLEKKVDARTPPTLLFHCDDDKVVPAVNSALFYQKLKEHGVKATLHIYPSGGHGWGMNPKFRYYGDWQKATLDWLSTL